jgi:hypothetical protein
MGIKVIFLLQVLKMIMKLIYKHIRWQLLLNFQSVNFNMLFYILVINQEYIVNYSDFR